MIYVTSRVVSMAVSADHAFLGFMVRNHYIAPLPPAEAELEWEVISEGWGNAGERNWRGASMTRTTNSTQDRPVA